MTISRGMRKVVAPWHRQVAPESMVTVNPVRMAIALAGSSSTSVPAATTTIVCIAFDAGLARRVYG